MNGATDTTDEDAPPAPTPPATAGHGRALVIAAIVVVAAMALAATGFAVVRRSRSDPGAAGPSACASLPTTTADAEGTPAIQPGDVLVHIYSSAYTVVSGPPAVVIDRSGNVLATDLTPAYARARLDGASLAAWSRCLESRDFRELGDYGDQLSDAGGGKRCMVSDAPETVVAAGPASSAVKVVRAYALSMTYDFGGSCYPRPRPLTDLVQSLQNLRSTVAAHGAAAEQPAVSLPAS